MIKQNIVFITGNANKLKEVREILGDEFAVININVDLQEIQSTDVKEVINEKIKEANNIFRKKDIMDKIKEEFKKLDIIINDFNDITVVCEDTGFHIDSLNNSDKSEKDSTKMFPGALIKFYFQALGSKGIIERDKDSKARLSCYIGVISHGEIKEPVKAIVEGKVANTLTEGGFGFDPCFVPDLDQDPSNDEYRGKAYSNLPSHIKNKISHRAVAFNNLKNMLLENKIKNTNNRIFNSKKRNSKKLSSKKKRKSMKGGLINDLEYYEKYLKYKQKYINLKNK